MRRRRSDTPTNSETILKLIQITDTHLSPGKRHFTNNWAPLLGWMEDQKADLIVHTGDLTVDGADKEADITFSMELMRQVSVPMLIVPGNHDVGHYPDMHQPVNAERLQRWRGLVGDDRFIEDSKTWRLIGINAMLLGLNNDEEAMQFEWLQKSLEDRNGRRVALFSHKPLFVETPDESDSGYWGVRPAQRQRLYDLIAAHDVALVGSGHTHWAWKGQYKNTALVWAPSTSFVIHKLEPELQGERLVGAVVHELSDTVQSEIVAVPGMVAHVLDDVVHEVYPHSAAPEAAA